MTEPHGILLGQFDTLTSATNGVNQLRRLVLALALRGELTDRTSRDNASALLVRAAALLNGQKLRRVEINPEPHPLPEGWTWTQPQRLGEVAPRNELRDDDVVGFVPMTMVPMDYRNPLRSESRTWGSIKKGFTHIADGDLAVAKITPCFQNQKSCVVEGLPGGLGAGTTELLVLRPVPGVVSPKYLLLFFKSPDFIDRGIPLMTGTAGQKRVPLDYFAAAPLPLPPLDEQKRIVAKVDQLMGLIDELEAKQTEKRELQTRLRTSALDALAKAEGLEELASAWKRVAANFGVLFERVDGVSALRKSIFDLAIRGCLVRKGVSKEIGAIGPFRVPSGWLWSPLSQVACKITDGEHIQPRFRDRGTVMLSAKDIATNGVALDDLRYVSIEDAANFRRRCDPQPGDLLMVGRGALVGKPCVVQNDVPTFCLMGSVIMLRFRAEFRSAFALIVFQSSYGQKELVGRARTMAQPALYLRDIRTFPVPIPPVAEQDATVAKVKALTALCDELEAKLRTNEGTADRLAEAVLRELVA